MISIQHKNHKIWGENFVTLSPFLLGSLRLKYCLIALKTVKGKILEIGCGAGAFVRGVKKYRNDLEVFGSDIDKNAITLAQQIDSKNQYIQADAQRMPYKDEQFSAVIAFDVIEHVNKPQKTINEIYRITKKNGVFYASIPLEAGLFSIHGWFRKFGFIPKKIYADHQQQYTTENILNLLKKAGFSNISYKYSGHLLQQIVDFCYFSLLFITKRKPVSTVEGYIDSLDKSLLKLPILLLRNALSFLFYLESILLKMTPGLIGHFTAYKK